MKLGFGLYYHMLNDEYFAFAKQCGATHITVHLTDYFYRGKSSMLVQKEQDQPIGDDSGWGVAGNNPHVWEYDYLMRLKTQLAQHGLILEAIENFDPAHWYALLLDLPEKDAQIKKLQGIVENIGRARIPYLGYNFSIAGVSSRIFTNKARGGAQSVGMNGVDTKPISRGMVWNMVYDENLLGTGFLSSTSHEVLWRRVEYFLSEIMPTAEKNGVKLAAHPDDPPAEFVRLQARLVQKPELYIKLLKIVPSKSNVLELCLGTLQEMNDPQGKDIYYWVECYAERGAIGYVHFRNVCGKVPHYHETFIDEGDIDMRRIIAILRKHNFEGMLIPDHTPLMNCDAPWHAGMAYAMGYMKALLT